MENNFLDSIIEKDTQLLIYLNNFGSEQWDSFWIFITNQFNWIPLFVIILVLILKRFGFKKGVFTLLFMVVLVTFSDQFTNLVKYSVNRVRPCNVPELQEYLRQIPYRSRGKSFWSGHACLSTTFTTFVILLLRSRFKFIYFLVLFPIFFGYSRIYLRVHYPIDVTTGYVVGIALGYLLYKSFGLLFKRVFKETI